jgi:signal transduction histidine kinase
MQLELRPVDLKVVVEAALDAVRPAATIRDITLDVAIDPRLDLIVGTPERLQQVVWNLLSNAVKFTPKRGRVQVEVRLADAEVQLTVSDTGQGIVADVLFRTSSTDFAKGIPRAPVVTGGSGLASRWFAISWSCMVALFGPRALVSDRARRLRFSSRSLP